MLDTAIIGIPNDLALLDHSPANEALVELVVPLVHPFGRALELRHSRQELAVKAIGHRERRIVDESRRSSGQSTQNVTERVVPELLDVRAELIALLFCHHRAESVVADERLVRALLAYLLPSTGDATHLVVAQRVTHKKRPIPAGDRTEEDP